jgi:hypothetical protein
VPAEAPFLFSIAAVSASLAGLAGLVAALRRNTGMRPLDLFRLREMVEFSFTSLLLALSIIPLTSILGSLESAVRIGGVAAVVSLVVGIIVLIRRGRRAGIAMDVTWAFVAVAINVIAITAALAAVVTGAIGAYEALLVIFLVRPMLAFLLVLVSFETD